MSKTLEPLVTANDIPTTTQVVIIGGGIVGVTAALALAERGVPVVLLEKGHIAGEQSSRNLGWIRKTSRHAHDVPLSLAADTLWANLPERIGRSVGYRQAGITFLARTPEQMAMYEAWHQSVQDLALDSQLLTPRQIDAAIPGGQGQWVGGIHTPSDGYAEPTVTTTAIAAAAQKRGAVLIQHCAVRGLSLSGGQVSGVVTEQGDIRCEQVLLAGGAWSRRFLGNVGVSLPTLPLVCSVLRTRPMTGPTDTAVGGPDFSFRKHQDGGYIITQRGKLDAPLTLDHLLIGWRYLAQLRTQRSFLKIGFGQTFFRDLWLKRRWQNHRRSPFERIRTMEPNVNDVLNQDALDNLKAAWPVFNDAAI
ncbi:MAG TPA: D-amino-acid oxidase, partial [Gammaproteobacteria bacterium]|nr:D-amino-acid oxidase [Gammaproteobacteria bacterium]